MTRYLRYLGTCASSKYLFETETITSGGGSFGTKGGKEEEITT